MCELVKHFYLWQVSVDLNASINAVIHLLVRALITSGVPCIAFRFVFTTTGAAAVLVLVPIYLPGL